jgi:autonomous glycyl radical cofactor GrcA
MGASVTAAEGVVVVEELGALGTVEVEVEVEVEVVEVEGGAGARLIG